MDQISICGWLEQQVACDYQISCSVFQLPGLDFKGIGFHWSKGSLWNLMNIKVWYLLRHKQWEKMSLRIKFIAVKPRSHSARNSVNAVEQKFQFRLPQFCCRSLCKSHYASRVWPPSGTVEWWHNYDESHRYQCQILTSYYTLKRAVVDVTRGIQEYLPERSSSNYCRP